MGYCIGTTTVTVTVYDANETEVFKQDLKVKVKKNATDVTVTGITDGDKFSVGQTVDVTLPRQGVDTDERELTVDKTDVAEVKAGEKARTYTVKFLKAGEATFTAKAYQSAKYPAATQSKTIKVTVGNPVPTEIKVVASNAYELKFAEDVEALGLFKDAKSIAEDACYYMSSDVKVPFTGVNTVKATGNTVKVTMFNNFTAGTEYFVVINESEPLSFKIAGAAAKDVARIAITKTSIVKDVETDPDVRLYNADEVDITESIKAAGLYTIDLKSSDDVKLYPSGGKVNMYNVGDTADLTATFTFYDDKDNYNPHPYTDTKKIVCIAAATAVKTGLVYTIGGSKDSPKHYFALGDELTFQAWLKETLNGNTVDRQVGKDDFGSVGATYARVADTSIAMITGVKAGVGGGPGIYEIVGNQKGSTYVFICYTDGSGNEVIFDTCAIEVREKRYPSSITASVNRSNLNKDAGSLTVTAIVKDQYGDPITTTIPTWTQLEQSKDKGTLNTTGGSAPAFSLNNANEGKYTMDLNYAANFTAGAKEGAVVLTIQAGNQSNKPNVQFSVASKTNNAPTAYDFAADKASVDTALKLKTAKTNVTVALTGTKDGYYVKDQAIAGVTKLDANGAVAGTFAAVLSGNEAIPTNSTVSGSGFVLDIKKDGKRLDLNANIADGVAVKYNAFFDSNSIDVSDGKVILASHVVDTGVIYKLPNGNYSFELYVVTNGKIGAIRRVNVAVSDSQVIPTFTKKEQSITKAGGTAAACFEFKFDGQTQANIAVADSTTNGYGADKTFVKKINVTISVAADNGSLAGTYTIPVTVNTLLDK